MIILSWFPLDWLDGSPCSSKNSQEPSPAPQFENINSSTLSLLSGPAVTSLHDYWKDHSFDYISSVQFSSGAQSCLTLATTWIAACQGSLSITNSRSSSKLMSIESVMPYSHLILYRPLLLLPSIPHSIRVFSNDSTLHIDLYKTHLIRLCDLSHFHKLFHFLVFPLKFILKRRSEQLGNYCLWYA